MLLQGRLHIFVLRYLHDLKFPRFQSRVEQKANALNNYFNSMFVLIPRSVDYSGTVLDMRSVAYLHLFNVSE